MIGCLGVRASVVILLWLLIRPRMGLVLLLSIIVITRVSVILALVAMISRMVRKFPPSPTRLAMLIGLWWFRG